MTFKETTYPTGVQEFSKRLAVFEQIEALREAGIHLTDAEEERRYIDAGVPRHPIGEPRDSRQLPLIDISTFFSQYRYVVLRNPSVGARDGVVNEYLGREMLIPITLNRKDSKEFVVSAQPVTVFKKPVNV